jgi:hypothetical protein
VFYLGVPEILVPVLQEKCLEFDFVVDGEHFESEK